MNYYDPHSGEQIRFLRQDPTGRWSPLFEQEELPKWWEPYLAGALLGVLIAFGLWWGL